MITELTAEQRLENIFLTLDSLDRCQRLADYGLDRELLLEIGVDKIIAQMDGEWNDSII
jgi:hypothetical protein